jgi:hypothetical protein
VVLASGGTIDADRRVGSYVDELRSAISMRHVRGFRITPVLTREMITTMSDRTRPLATYLNDHLAGAAAGSNLARSIASANVGTAQEAPTRQLAEQIDEDRQKLLEIIDQLGISRQAIKEAVGLLSEKVSKLKLSAMGSPGLAQFLRLEALIAGVTAKRQLWRTLKKLDLEAPTSDEIDELVRRADGQLAALERLHEESGQEVLA